MHINGGPNAKWTVGFPQKANLMLQNSPDEKSNKTVSGIRRNIFRLNNSCNSLLLPTGFPNHLIYCYCSNGNVSMILVNQMYLYGKCKCSMLPGTQKDQRVVIRNDVRDVENSLRNIEWCVLNDARSCGCITLLLFLRIFHSNSEQL